MLIATDVASRGLHIDGVSHVLNYDLPQDCEDYVHRIGRTARAGAEGKAISLADEDGAFYVEAIEEYIKEKIPVEWAEDEMFVTDYVRTKQKPREPRTAGKPAFGKRPAGKPATSASPRHVQPHLRLPPLLPPPKSRARRKRNGAARGAKSRQGNSQLKRRGEALPRPALRPIISSCSRATHRVALTGITRTCSSSAQMHLPPAGPTPPAKPVPRPLPPA